jgi:hypothetical protein
MSKDEMESVDSGSIAKTVRLARNAAIGQRYIADEWSKLAPDDITAIGFAWIGKATCGLLRSNAELIETLTDLIERLDREVRKCQT